MNEPKKLQDDLTENCEFHMPATYLPGGGPHFWMQEYSGILASAVKAFLDREQILEPRQIVLLKEYFAHWIMAPCFRWDPDWTSRPAFCARLERAESREDLWGVLHALLDIGMDPL